MTGKSVPELFAIYRESARLAGDSREAAGRRQCAESQARDAARELYERFGLHCLNTLRAAIARKGGKLAGIRVGRSTTGNIDSEALDSLFNRAWEAFLKHLLGQQELSIQSPEKYLWRIIENSHRLARRKTRTGIRGRTVTSTDLVSHTPSAPDNNSEVIQAAADAEQLRIWIQDETDEDMREILEGYLSGECKTYVQIGAKLNLSSEAVRKRFERWIEKKRRGLKENDHG